MDRYTEPDFRAAALITIDTQRDTLDGQPLEIPGTSSILPKMSRLLSAFRALQRPIVHVVRLYKPDGSNVDLCRRTAVETGQGVLAPGTPGSQLAPGLLPDDHLSLDSDALLSGNVQTLSSDEVIIYKPRWGAFYQTCLEDHLRRLRVTTVIFTGCNFPNCPRTSIMEASERDFRIVLVRDAVSGLSEPDEVQMAKIGVSVLSTEELLARLGCVRSL
ncbi:MAG TPA: isochorismatase family cysteine hydrolase [Terriglobia bacterium]|nr:isochorismatase family cysteine hydrolase [Terriglobia bacterium]